MMFKMDVLFSLINCKIIMIREIIKLFFVSIWSDKVIWLIFMLNLDIFFIDSFILYGLVLFLVLFWVV